MKELPSAEFRKRYARLTVPTLVTVNGHAIGVWQPWKGPELLPAPAQPERPILTAQARRDVLLRRINRQR